MTRRSTLAAHAGAALAGLLGVAVFGTAPAGAVVTEQECAAKFKAAQTTNTLGTMSWDTYRKVQCGGPAAQPVPAASTPAAPAPATPAGPGAPASPTTPGPASG